MRRRLLFVPVLALALAMVATGGCRQAIGIDAYENAPAAGLTTDAGQGGDATVDAGADAPADAGADATADVGAGTDAAANGDAGACGMSYGTGTCRSCAQSSCCSELSACAASHACALYEACLGGCGGDPQCRSQCTIDHPVGQSPEVSNLGACLASSCENQCDLSCGAVAGYFVVPAAAAGCQNCLVADSTACNDAHALGALPDGDAYLRCILASTTEDLRQVCRARHPAGAARFDAFKPDWSGTCMTPCKFGNYWACVGNVSWPLTDGGPVSTTIRVVDFGSYFQSSAAPVAGATVAVCAGCPCQVGTSLDRGTTDDAGIVTLGYGNTVDVNDHGLNGCFDVTSPNITEMYVYWDYPVTVGSDNTGDRTDNINAVSPQELRQLLLGANVGAGALTQDLATRGNVAAVVKDCLGNPAPGVTLAIDSADPGMLGFYGMNLAAGTATDATGVGGFMNVPPGTRLITARPAGLTQPSSSFHIQVAAGVVTESQMYPMP